jgi:hypothetical protein
MRTITEQVEYTPPQVTDLGDHASFIQTTTLGVISDGVPLTLPGGFMIVGTISPR